MTKEEAIAEQERIGKHFNLAWWFGVHCKKCCGVYPRFEASNGFDLAVWYQCPVCGKKSTKHGMPWLAERAWNKGEYETAQIGWF